MSNYEQQKYLRKAALALGHSEPISIEPDGTIWIGTDEARQYLTDKEQKAVQTKAEELSAKNKNARASALAKLAALGLTDDEIAALLP